MKITRKFTTIGQDPFATVKWSKRTSRITNPDGSIVFQMDDAEIPETWSQLATDIMVSKYFRKAGVPLVDGAGKPVLDEHGKPRTGPEKSARQVIHRLAGCWRHWGEKHHYFDTPGDAKAFYDELVYMLVHQMAAPNSPQWFNTGLNFAYGITGPAQGHFVPDPHTGKVDLAKDAYTHPQPHACFIQSVSDDLVNEGGIMDLWVREARLFKYGSGTGTNFSHLRADGEKLSGGGRSSGLMSWLKIGDRAAAAIKSGGTTRRAAKMVCLDMDHPDIGDFVNWKVREEIKVQAMVEGFKTIAGKKSGPADEFTIGETAAKLGLKLDYDFNGEAYLTVSGQNSNNSVRIPDAFFDALDSSAEWKTFNRTNQKLARTYKSADLWDQIAYAAWRCADPGVQFDTTINAWHTCPAGGRINASNPCVTADALVSTTTGYRRIGDLVGQVVEVINGKGEAALVEKVFKTGTKHVYRLTTRSGYSLKLTGDHKVLTANRGDVPACELTRDDVVILKGAGFGDAFLPEQFGEIVGAALGDGCVTRQPGQSHLFISVGSGDGDLARQLQANMDHCKQWLSTGDARSTRPTGVVQTQTGLRVGTSVEALLERVAQYALLDAGTQAKRLTDAVFALDRRSQAAILRGLFTADGTVADYSDKSQYVALDSVSAELLRQAQLLLLSFGIKSKLYTDRRALGQETAMLPDGKGGMREYPVQQINSLRISRSSRVAFEREVGFMAGSAKSARLSALDRRVDAYEDRMLDRVDRLEPLGVEDVFDLTEPTTHHFVANGMVVHNCSEYMFLDNTACNLASLNVMKFYDSQSRAFDVDRYEHAIDLWTIVLEISVLMASFPSREVAELSYKYRTLGLGYANLGAMLMQAGIAYDSEEARAVCSTLTAILTGRSYRQSAIMAAQLGAFEGYAANKDAMLKVVRNHRRAAHGVARDVPVGSGGYEDLRIAPVPINHEIINTGRIHIANADDLLDHAVRAWDEAVTAGDKYGYRNAQVTVIAPTGTIGLLMDCDTTGIEPDFALVKFKKLAGGGYFKIANASVKPALQAMGYDANQCDAILTYLLGTLHVDVPLPGTDGSTATGTTFKRWLMSKGLLAADIEKIDAALPGVFELGFAFNAWTLGDDAVQRLGIDAARSKADHSFNLLRELGLTRKQIDALNEVICGQQTVEGAPHLKDTDLSVFDCANTCGKRGKRFIAPHGHIRMMAAAQPFISGAISKTINLPNDASIQDIKDCYRLSWELGLKANALYRDGCKLSQPLNSSSDTKEEEAPAVEKAAQRTAEAASTVFSDVPVEVEPLVRIVERPMRRRLPDTRASITHKFNIAGHEGYITVGLYEDGTPGELFITMAKEGSTIGGMMDSLGTAISVALQYGVPVEGLVNKFTHQRFEPAGMTANRDIPFAKSFVDYIFRWMGMEFIPGYREANAPRREAIIREDSFLDPRKGGGRMNMGSDPVHAMTDEEESPESDAIGVEGSSQEVRTPWNETPALASVTSPAVPAKTGPNAPTSPSVAPAIKPGAGDSLLLGGGPRAAQATTRPSASPSARNTASAGSSAVSALSMAMRDNQQDAPACDSCGAITVRSGTCYKCLNCGASMGCS